VQTLKFHSWVPDGACGHVGYLGCPQLQRALKLANQAN